MADLTYLIQNGFEYEIGNIKVILKCIVCDALARALVKNVKQYSGYFGCGRCSQKGVRFWTISYQDVHQVKLRTNTSPRNQVQPELHHGVFYDLLIDLVKIFLVDYTHQACLGLMRRLLLFWIRGPRAVPVSGCRGQ